MIYRYYCKNCNQVKNTVAAALCLWLSHHVYKVKLYRICSAILLLLLFFSITTGSVYATSYTTQVPSLDSNHVKGTSQYNEYYPYYSFVNGGGGGLGFVTGMGNYTNQNLQVDLGSAYIIRKIIHTSPTILIIPHGDLDHGYL
jgi:hypothetical protein